MTNTELIGAKKRARTSLIRLRVWCPTLDREAEVEFSVQDEVPSAVKRCSVLDFSVAVCREACLRKLR